MGSYHGAEICDLIGLHMLSKLAQWFDEGCFGLYRDDGLAIVDGTSAQKLDNIRKTTIATFKDAGFRIFIQRCWFPDHY